MDPKEKELQEQKRQEEIAMRLEATEGTYEDMIGDKGGNEGGEEDGGEDFTPSPYWDLIKSKLPEEERNEFKMPEGISKDNEQEFLDKHFEKIYSKGEVQGVNIEELPPLAREIYEKSKEENFDPNAYLSDKAKSLSWKNKNDDDLLVDDYIEKIGIQSEENPNGLPIEEIKKGIESLNVLEKRERANKIRKEKEESEKHLQSNFQVSPEARQKKIDDWNSTVKTTAEDLFEKEENLKELRVIAGVDLGEAKVKAWKDNFIKGFSVNEKGAIHYRDLLFNDDKVLAKAILFLEHEKDIAEALTKKFGEGKDIILDTLDLKPRREGGSVKDDVMTDEEIKNKLDSPHWD